METLGVMSGRGRKRRAQEGNSYPHKLQVTAHKSLRPRRPTNNMKFTGHERDPETNLDYMLARYYTSGSGRFLQVDPGYDYDPMDPMSFNLYGYVRGNPIMGTDPTGQFYGDALADALNKKQMDDMGIMSYRESAKIDRLKGAGAGLGLIAIAEPTLLPAVVKGVTGSAVITAEATGVVVAAAVSYNEGARGTDLVIDALAGGVVSGPTAALPVTQPLKNIAGAAVASLVAQATTGDNKVEAGNVTASGTSAAVSSFISTCVACFSPAAAQTVNPVVTGILNLMWDHASNEVEAEQRQEESTSENKKRDEVPVS